MKRIFFNMVINALSLLVFVSMISTGLILKFILPPGSGRVETLFQGSGRFERTIDLYLGLTRHDWGEIHFYISIIFLTVLVLHLILHWNWIQVVSFGTKQCPQSFHRWLISFLIIVFIIVSVLIPWIFGKKTYTKSEFIQLRNIEATP